MKFFRIAATAALLALACGTAAAQTTLRIGLAEDPDILDPTLARTYVGRIVFASICDKLFDIDENLNVVPQLALSHETSPDGKTVTIKLRPGVKFQDGEIFDAEAAKYSLERHLTMQGSFRKSEISAIDHIEVVDPLTIRLILKTPYAPLIAQLTDRSGMMVAPNAARAAGDKFGLHPVCAGPYKFVERVQQDHITVEKFADYWNKDNIHIDRIVYQTVTDGSVRLASLKSGGLDIAERLLATDIKDIRADKKLQLATALWLGYQGVDINVGDNPQAKATPLGRLAKVREALNLAIDRDAINQVVFNGEFVPGNQWISPANPWYQQSFPVPKRDLAKAKALMAQAGVTAPFSVDFMVPKGDENQAIAEMIQAMAKDIGIDMKIRVTEFATSLKQAEVGAYQAFLLDWSGRADPDGNAYSFYICKGPLDYTQFCDPAADKLLNEERTVGDFAARKAVFEKLTKLILDQSPIIYLYHRKILMGVSTRVEGYKQVPDGMIRVVGLKLR
ncbi:MAG TPA: ABC transporter substrate-binding protein [Xanthobacteraceae bacterium]|nr:ABC transporter substrate-binding protein [Xanthobacteraceae bacterium]